MATPPHSKIINKAAREILKPIGVVRKGQSRVWLDDNGWWVTVIEFQPSSWSKGTYLNIGVNWQWYAKEHFSFDLGYRDAGFVEFKSDQHFERKAVELANLAKAKVEEIRKNLSNLKRAKQYIVTAYHEEPFTIWSNFHLGVACALAGDINEANRFFADVENDTDDRDWAVELKVFAAKLRELAKSTSDLKVFICNQISEARRMKKLNEWECDLW